MPQKAWNKKDERQYDHVKEREKNAVDRMSAQKKLPHAR